MIKKSIKLLLITLGLFSCEAPHESTSIEYFDIKSLFNAQIKKLEIEKPYFVKNVEINGKKESHETNKNKWAKELDPFLQSDLNKAAFLGSYEITETDTTIRYLLKKEVKSPIYSIWILKKKSTNEVLNIDVASHEENFLYSWQKDLSASFEKGLLKSYSIKGTQKILIFKEENYKIISKRK